MRTSLTLTLLLVACSPAAEQPAANQTEPAPSEQEAAPVPSLAGQWAVTDVNGAPLDQIFDMTAQFDSSRLSIRSDCVGMSWAYSQDRNIVAFSDASTSECPRGRTHNEDQVERAIESANMALFVEEGRQVQLSGSGGTVTMARR